jgi:hypothetical protein
LVDFAEVVEIIMNLFWEKVVLFPAWSVYVKIRIYMKFARIFIFARMGSFGWARQLKIDADRSKD